MRGKLFLVRSGQRFILLFDCDLTFFIFILVNLIQLVSSFVSYHIDRCRKIVTAANDEHIQLTGPICELCAEITGAHLLSTQRRCIAIVNNTKRPGTAAGTAGYAFGRASRHCMT